MDDAREVEVRLGRDFLTCRICFEIFKKPKTLSCLHPFCEQCLSKYIQSKTSSRTKEGVNCPICREFTKIPRPTEDISQWAGQLIDDFRAVCMIDALGLQNPTGQTEAPLLCPQHGYKLELVCVNCDSVPVCSTCVAVSHRMCTQVYTVATAAQEKRSCLGYLLAPIEQRLEKVACRQTELVKEKNLVQARKEQVEKELKEKYEEAVKILTEKYESLKQNLSEKYEECMKEYNKEAESLKDVKDQLEKCQMETENVFKESDMIVLNKYYDLSNQLHEVAKSHQEVMAPHVPEYILSFEANARVPDTLAAVSLGDIYVRKRERVLHLLLSARATSISSQSSLSPTLSISPLASPSAAVRFVNKFSPKVRSDVTVSSLRDVTVVSGNVIVVTDGDNKAVKSFYTEGMRAQSSQHRTSRMPHGIAKLSGNTVVVMVPKQKEMLILDVTPIIMLQRNVHTAKSYYAVTALSPERLAVSTCPGYGPPSIDIIDTEGRLCSVVRDVSNVGNLLSNPMSMCATPEGDIVITDPTLPSIVCIRQNGFKVFEFESSTDYKMKFPNSVSIDKQGAILIADKDSNSIVLLSPEGIPVRRLISKSDKMESKPKAVAVGERGMVVTIHEKRICVFEVRS